MSTPRRWGMLFRGNVLWLSVISLLNDVASEMIYPLLPLFLVSLGAGPAFIGLTEGVAETTASFVKLAGGRLSDRWSRRKPLALAGYSLAAVTRPLVAIATTPWHVLAVRFTDRIGKGVRTAPRDALLAESVPPEVRGTAFGFHRASDHAGAVLGPLLATWYLAEHPGALRSVFWLASIPALIGVVLLFAFVRDTPRQMRPSTEAAPATLASLGPRFTAFLGIIVLFTLGNASDAFLLLRARQLGIDVALLPVLWSVFHVSKMMWSVPGGALADRFGPRGSIIAGWILYALVYAGFAFAQTPLHAWLLFGVYGLFYGLTESPEKALVAQLAPDALRASAFGAYHFAIGLAALPASVLFGYVWERFSPETAFLLGGGFAVVAALALGVFPGGFTTENTEVTEDSQRNPS